MQSDLREVLRYFHSILFITIMGAMEAHAEQTARGKDSLSKKTSWDLYGDTMISNYLEPMLENIKNLPPKDKCYLILRLLEIVGDETAVMFGKEAQFKEFYNPLWK